MRQTTIDYINEQVEKNKEMFNEKSWYSRVYSLLDVVAKITTGIYSSKIRIEHIRIYSSNSRTDTNANEYNVGYSVNGGEYQYYRFVLDMNTYKIKSIKGDCRNEIEKIVDIFNNIGIEDLLKWEKICDTFKSEKTIKNLNNTDYSVSWVDKDKDVKDIEKINKLLKLHKNLLIFNDTNKIIETLNIIYPYWEIDNFTIKQHCSEDILYGNFKSYDIPSVEVNEKELIIFPEARRDSMCTNFIALNNFNELKNKNIGDIIELLYNRKGSKPKQYQILEINYEGFYAVRNLKTNKIEFIANELDIQDAYDALFDCNKAIYNSWYRKKYVMVV